MTAWPLPRPWRRARSNWRRTRAMPVRSRSWSDWTPWAYAIVAAPLVLLLVEVLRGAVHDVSMIRTQTLQAELQQLQSRALQRAKGLEVLIEARSEERRVGKECRVWW